LKLAHPLAPSLVRRGNNKKIMQEQELDKINNLKKKIINWRIL
jgi:hypothetical protein